MSVFAPAPATTLTYAVARQARSELLDWFTAGLRRTMEAHGHRAQAIDDPGTRVVLNLIDPERPRPHRRKAQATFVVSVIELPERPADVLRTCYPILIRALSNLLICLVPGPGRPETHFVTLEQGSYPLPPQPSDGAYFAHVYQRLAPLASSRLVVDNIFDPDLPESLWRGDELTDALYRAGQKLDRMNLLPAAFPIQELLPARDFRHVQRLYGIGGLSYGNLSARKDSRRFWMSASGVNKANLRVVGQDVLLIKGFDPHRNAMLLSVPPNVRPRRVSVDAIEHWMIYTEHPAVGAIVHVHAWIEGVASTEINYPCGTLQLAQSVADLVRAADDPSRAIIGLKNHGLTITGRSLDDIFERIEGRIVPQVPMA